MVSNLLATAAMAAPLLEPSGDTETTFDIITFLQNAAGYLKTIGHYLMILVGVILVIVAVIQIAKGFANGGRGQVNWVMSIACLLVGGLLIFGGWNAATMVASIGGGTIDSIASGEYADEVNVGADGSNAGQQGYA